MFVNGVGILVRVTDRVVIYFHFFYYLAVLTTRQEVSNSFPSPSSVSFGLSTTIVIIGCLSVFHFIVDSKS